MPTPLEPLPTDLASAHAMLLAERSARTEAEADAAHARAVQSNSEALIVNLKLEIEKLRRQLYGARSERKMRLLDQLELQLEGHYLLYQNMLIQNLICYLKISCQYQFQIQF